VYNPGDENAFGEHHQPNEMGADLCKDKRQKELVALFDRVLKPRGWRMDRRPPPTACAKFSFVPASLASVDKLYLYKHGIAGKHYAVEWTGLRSMVEKYKNVKTYAPVMSAQADPHAAGVEGEANEKEAEDEDARLIGGDGTPAATAVFPAASAAANNQQCVQNVDNNPVMVQVAAPTAARRDVAYLPPADEVPGSQQLQQNTNAVSLRVVDPRTANLSRMVAPTIAAPPGMRALLSGSTSGAAAAVAAPVVTSRSTTRTTAGGRSQQHLSLQDLYAHKRLLENDLIHLEDILNDDTCSAPKRARIEVEIVDQKASYSLVKKAILDGYVPTAIHHDL
jgi:hypothetical protein